MELPDHYQWEAELADGTVINQGGDLDGAVRFSLLPQAPGLMRHDLIGVPMLRRFGRGFIRVTGAGLVEYVHCVVCRDFRVYVRSSDGTVLVTPADYELYL